MQLQDIAGWVAPIATMIAAMMTAANLGSRVTGWGFVVFVAGSICWSIVGATSGQTNLLATNGFLTLVNIVGVWRWLGRQASYDDGGTAAAKRSAASSVPTLFSASALIGAKVIGPGGEAIGSVVDSMTRCDTSSLAYVVVAEGGVVGVGERLHALDPHRLRFSPTGVKCDLSADALRALAVLPADNWPAALPGSSAGGTPAPAHG